MKKFLSLVLLVVLVTSVLVVVSSATSTTTYWEIDSLCLVKARTLDDDGFVPTFKTSDGDCHGLLVGLPMDAKYYSVENDQAFFQPKTGYSIKYFDEKGDEIKTEGTHIGTTDVIKVYDSTGAEVAKYGIVTYGDADGDGVVDVLDAYVAALCLNGFVESANKPAIYEAVKPRENSDNEAVEAEDYQQIVNDAVANTNAVNKKGRKIPVDDSISFESVIYACDGNAKVAAVNIPDSNFKSIASIRYNGNEDAPSDPGIYSITAEIPDNTDYLVAPGNRSLGFMVIAPKNSPGYAVDVDNTNKKITVNINNFYAADTTFDSYISGWYNSAYSLTMAGNSVSSGEGAISSLSPRTVIKYWHETVVDDKGTTDTSDDKKTLHMRLTDSADLLGCYLPDDYTLWNNKNANKTISVSVDNGQPLDFTLVFQQDNSSIKKLQQEYLLAKAKESRGQRFEDPAETQGSSGFLDFSTKGVFLATERAQNSSTGARENTVSVILGNGRFYPGITSAFDGTGLKTVLVGHNDTIMFTSSDTKANLGNITSSATLLYNVNSDNRRYSNYTGTEIITNSSTFLGVINDVLGGMNISLSITSSTEDLVGKSGWCRYACAGTTSGLRYTVDTFLQFNTLNTTNDNHNSINVVAVDGCTITTTPTQTETYVEKDDDGNVVATFYHKESMTKDEVFRVSATLADGYKPSVTDASGNAVEYDAENDWYIMPNSNVTVTAVHE